MKRCLDQRIKELNVYWSVSGIITFLSFAIFFPVFVNLANDVGKCLMIQTANDLFLSSESHQRFKEVEIGSPLMLHDSQEDNESPSDTDQAKEFLWTKLLTPGLDNTRLFISLTAGAGTRCMSLLSSPPSLSETHASNTSGIFHNGLVTKKPATRIISSSGRFSFLLPAFPSLIVHKFSSGLDQKCCSRILAL